jgi:hypothetical protein
VTYNNKVTKIINKNYMPLPSLEAAMANPPAIIETVSIRSKKEPLGSQLLESRNSVLGLLKEPVGVIKAKTSIAEGVLPNDILRGIKIPKAIAELVELNQSLRNIRLGKDFILDLNATGGSVKIEYKKEI